MYHYVREPDADYPYFKNLHFEDFKKQLDYFQEEFGFVSRDAFLNAFSSGQIPKGVVLTFDDGFRDHYDYVFPELKKRGLFGLFYISTGFYETDKILDVHRIHLLLGKFSSKDILARLQLVVKDNMLTYKHKNEYKTKTYVFQSNDDYTNQVKRTLNYYIDPKYKTEVLDLLMTHFFSDEKSIAKNFYITKEEAKEMHDEGMIIGSHTESHALLSNLSEEAQTQEIENSFNWLEKNVGKLRIKTFCYPYGGFHSFTKFTEMQLAENGCLFSFNVEPRDINKKDVLNRPQALPRYDCNQFKFGSCR